MKRFLTILTVIAVALTMGFVAFEQEASAAQAKKIGKAKAKKIALKNARVKAKQTCHLKVRYDKKERNYEVKFTKKKNCSKYQYDIAPYNGRILKKNIDFKYKKCCSKKRIGVRAAQKRVAKFSKTKLSVIKKGTCQFEKKRCSYKYEIKFRKGKYEYECDVLARNGKIIEWEYKYIGKK